MRAAGARIRLIEDGDVAAAIATCFEDTGVDVLMGTGGAPEGVIAAAALEVRRRRLAGPTQAAQRRGSRPAPKDGHQDFDRIYTAEELAQGEVMFAATGVTGGDFLTRGALLRRWRGDPLRRRCGARPGTVRYVQATHKFDKKPGYAP